MVRNKARLIVQGYTQVEGLDYDETYASSHLGPYKWYRSRGHRFNQGLTSFGVKNDSNYIQSCWGQATIL
jgi:hypothetical protein